MGDRGVSRSPSNWCPFSPLFGWEGSPAKMDYREKIGYRLILTSQIWRTPLFFSCGFQQVRLVGGGFPFNHHLEGSFEDVTLSGPFLADQKRATFRANLRRPFWGSTGACFSKVLYHFFQTIGWAKWGRSKTTRTLPQNWVPHLVPNMAVNINRAPPKMCDMKCPQVPQ